MPHVNCSSPSAPRPVLQCLHPWRARLYLDVGSHPEFATAECDELADLLAQDRAGEITMADLAEQANTRLEQRGVPGRIHLLKNNLDAEGTGFGCHENSLARRGRLLE